MFDFLRFFNYFRKSPTEARTEAVANEKRCFMESGQRKAGYINLVVKTIQGLRNRKKQEAEKSRYARYCKPLVLILKCTNVGSDLNILPVLERYTQYEI